MTKKQLVDKFKQNMPEFTGTEEEKQLKTALYIYVELGKHKSFDEKYYFGNSDTKKKIYKLAQRESNNIEEIINKRKIICLSLTNLYSEILKEFDISAIPTEPDEDGHINTTIITTKNNKYAADLQLDLENIQTKSKLRNFKYVGNIDKENKAEFDDDKLTNMLIEVGYINNEKEYKNHEINRLKAKVKNKTAKEALKIFVKDEDIYKDNEEMDIIELNKFYRGVLRKIVPSHLDKRIFLFSCYKLNESNEKDYTCCTFTSGVNVEDLKVYLFSKKKRRFLEADIDKLDKLVKDGLVLGAKPGELGTKLLKKHLKNNKAISNDKTKKEEVTR